MAKSFHIYISDKEYEQIKAFCKSEGITFQNFAHRHIVDGFKADKKNRVLANKKEEKWVAECKKIHDILYEIYRKISTSELNSGVEIIKKLNNLEDKISELEDKIGEDLKQKSS